MAFFKKQSETVKDIFFNLDPGERRDIVPLLKYSDSLRHRVHECFPSQYPVNRGFSFVCTAEEGRCLGCELDIKARKKNFFPVVDTETGKLKVWVTTTKTNRKLEGLIAASGQEIRGKLLSIYRDGEKLNTEYFPTPKGGTDISEYENASSYVNEDEAFESAKALFMETMGPFDVDGQKAKFVASGHPDFVGDFDTDEDEDDIPF